MLRMFVTRCKFLSWAPSCRSCKKLEVTVVVMDSGGLGLTGGIADVGSLFDALMGIHLNLASESILDTYSDVRRKIWTEIINPMSRENYRRLVDRDADTARETDGFFRACVEAERDEGLARELAMVSIPFLCFVFCGCLVSC